MNPERCKQQVADDTGFHWFQCKRKPWKDGFCKQHHPDSVVLRNEKAHKRYQEQWENSPSRKLERLKEKMKNFKAAVKNLRSFCIPGITWSDEPSLLALKEVDAFLKEKDDA